MPRTSNLLERLNREIKRRTRVATLFPNTESIQRLVSAIVMEVNEEWKTGPSRDTPLLLLCRLFKAQARQQRKY